MFSVKKLTAAILLASMAGTASADQTVEATAADVAAKPVVEMPDFEAIRKQMDAERAEIEAEMEARRAAHKAEMDQHREEIRKEIDARRAEMDKHFESLRAEAVTGK
ncbi:hypothetical protein BOW14_06395 [Solemya velum gill symbiont]|uniref:hypothetical protein n=1 Tax=Solemya velum gill symbiont TaxID=2340 RepID=UPI0009979F39|nr:hypothetical protein [Solemya velum gill symbiont]OOY55161.1 hypothetical protein BOV99_08600 [Solemya velum gill symbiont]OOY56052.1 hypothetical protein BOW00_08605 [Solemya velum gill symbiont]OOY87173.1 hypothetical protein BOW14_06395 [Solemya velum gill symbiont]